MAALSPTSEDDVRKLLLRVATIGTAEISNHNSPSQFVIAGDPDAIRAALAIAEDEFFLHGVVIETRIPMHCRLFAGVAEAFRPRLARVAWRPASRPYLANVTGEIVRDPVPAMFIESLARHVHQALANVTGEIVRDPVPAMFIESLARHVHQAVLWRQSIEAVVRRYPEAIFIEVGPRSVLFNLLHPRWLTQRKLKTDDEGDPLRQADRIAAELERLTRAR
jgi:[acyl-carrier-protein] S-malonyltransferase